MRTVSVRTAREYEVLIGEGLLEELPERLQRVCLSDRVCIITDDLVENLFLTSLERNLKDAGFEVSSYTFPHGEQSKNLQTLSDILEFLAARHFRRNDTVIALGGGVVGDTAGFAASVYMRGISFVQIPTTLLSAVDASVGGKTAVDLQGGKNLAGTFWQPSLVLCDTKIIKHLPIPIFNEGMAEVIKCNVIRDLPIICRIEEGSVSAHLEEIIYDCVTLKKDIVEDDERDIKGIRNILNAGHTIGHAIEALSGYTVSHGHAVGTGLMVESQMAFRLGLCERETVDRIAKAVNVYGLKTPLLWSAEQLTGAMRKDKKNRDDLITFEFPLAIGTCKETKLSREKTICLLEDTIRPNNTPVKGHRR